MNDGFALLFQEFFLGLVLQPFLLVLLIEIAEASDGQRTNPHEGAFSILHNQNYKTIYYKLWAAMKDQKVNEEKMLLGKYRCKKLLGKGSFGTVQLVESNDGMFAMKLIDKEMMKGDNQYLADYLKGEIQCMKEMEYEHFVKLQDFEEDDKYFYLLLEYCDGGDLLNLQAGLQNKVFPLHMALELMSQVIIGLQALHNRGYIHRDIKPQNVLVKTVLGKKILKVADFGFAKKANRVEGTIIGTDYFMSPQIYQQGIDISQNEKETYGFEVDVWAFGVLLFYMLNNAYPFQIVPAWTFQMKFDQLGKQARQFSYQKKVSKTRKKITQNCTEEIEDLFYKIFTIDRQKRITFKEMRSHPVFAGFFENKLQKTLSKPKSDKNFNDQKLFLKLELEEIDFLGLMAENIYQVDKNIGQLEALMFAYHLTKYQLILYQQFARELTVEKYAKRYSCLDWLTYFSTNSFGEVKQSLLDAIKRGRIKYNAYFEKCQLNLEKLCELNPDFSASFKRQIYELELTNPLYSSYRTSVNLIYQRLKAFLKLNKILSYYCLLCMSCICYVFADIYDDQRIKSQIFKEYFAQQTQKLPKFSYKRLVQYLNRGKKEDYLNLAKKIITDCTKSQVL